MIISKSIDDVDYPLNGHFKVIGYCQEKSQKQVQILNDKTYILLNSLLVIEQLMISFIAIYHYLYSQDVKQVFIIFGSLFLLGLFIILICTNMMVQSLKRLSNYLQSQITTNILSVLIACSCTLPIVVIKNASTLLKQVNKWKFDFDYQRVIVFINSHKKFIICMQLHIVVKMYTVLIINYFNNQDANAYIDNLQWVYFSLLFLINMIIIQQVLKLQFIINFNKESSKQIPKINQNGFSCISKDQIKMFLWQTITYFETFIQMSQTLIFLLLCVQNTLLATIAIVIWCLYSFFYCYQNIFELFQQKSGEINTSRSLFFGYRVDYLHGLHSHEFQQLKMYQNIQNYIKLAFVFLYKATIIAVSLFYFEQNQNVLNYFNTIIIIIDTIIFLSKIPYYFMIFFRSNDFSFSIQIRPNDICSDAISDINIFNKYINIVIYNPIKEYSKKETCLIENILSCTDKMIYFEIYDQVRIYNKFGHLEVQIIKFSKPLYEWVATRVKLNSKSIRIMIFSMYNSKVNIINIIKDQLVQIQFDPTFKNNFSYLEVINQIPLSYFPIKELKKITIEYSKEKVFYQIMSYYKYISPLIINNPQQVLYDLIEI